MTRFPDNRISFLPRRTNHNDDIHPPESLTLLNSHSTALIPPANPLGPDAVKGAFQQIRRTTAT